MAQLKQYLPRDLGKVVYEETCTPKECINSALPATLWTLLFSAFGVSVVAAMLYRNIQEFDAIALAIALLFSVMILPSYRAFVGLFRVQLYAVCDKGLAVFTFGRDNKLKNTKILFFNSRWKAQTKTHRDYHIAGRHKYTYSVQCALKEGKQTVFELWYHYATEEELQTNRQKIVCDKLLQAFEKYKIQQEERTRWAAQYPH